MPSVKSIMYFGLLLATGILHFYFFHHVSSPHRGDASEVRNVLYSWLHTYYNVFFRFKRCDKSVCPPGLQIVTELLQGDSSRNIVEIIFRTSWLKTKNPHGIIERVLKVHNMQKTLANFEGFHDIVMSKESKFPNKHPRCLEDGNELLRFHGTTIMCSLGTNGSSSLCNIEGCNVCRIIRTGFSVKEAGCRGIYTTATSGRAHDSIAYYEDDLMFPTVKKALLVCTVIAG